MDEEWDVEALLEAPFIKQGEINGKTREKEITEKENKTDSQSEEKESKSHKKKSSSHSKSKTKDRKSRSHSTTRRSRSESKGRRSRSRSKGKKSRSGSRDQKKNTHPKDKDKRHRSRSKTRKSRSPVKEFQKRPFKRDNLKWRSRSRSKERKHANKVKPRSKSRSPKREDKRVAIPPPSAFVCSAPGRNPNLTPEERDMRTIFCMQLSQRVRARDLEEFFCCVGKVQDVRIIMDNKTRRSKGIAYVEFADPGSVTLAMGLTGQKLLGVPIVVQPTQAEKNRAAASANNLQKGNVGPMRLYVGSLHFNITETMLKGIFEPFGKIDRIELIKDPETGRSKGYGFISFHDSESAKKALDQLNGFELAGRPMKVGNVTDRTDFSQGPSYLDTEEMDRAGIDLGATGRLQLMAKLAEGTGFELPQAAVTALTLTSNTPPAVVSPVASVATQCFMLSNMFDPAKETSSSSGWDEEIRNDVIEECRNHGGALHVYVDKMSPEGHVYVKCPSVTAAMASVNVLHGRYFAGRIITAAYVPAVNYHTLFPDSANAIISL